MLSTPVSIVQRLSTKKQTRSSHGDAVNSPACQINSFIGLRSWFRGCSPSCCIASSVRTDSRIAPSLWHRRRQQQLSHVFDLDLWRPARPGLDEQFDAERFGVWIEVLVEAGADLAAEKLSQMPIEQLIAGFAHHARVFEIGAIGAFETTDGELIESRSWAMG